MKDEKISVIVPIYNVSEYLDRCMESLLNQTYTDFEIIMVDDGSPDDCGMKCDVYAMKDKRIRVIHKENAGLGMARNSGLEIASGTYVAFVDSDDYVDEKMLENMYCCLKKKNADTCFCRYYDVSNSGKKTLAAETYKRAQYQGDEVRELILAMIGSEPNQPGDVEIGMSVWKGLYSLSIIKQYHIQFPSERQYISEDIIFHIDYLKKAQCVAIEETPCYYYCNNGKSLTQSYKANRFEMEKILYEKEYVELEKQFKEYEYKQRLYKSFLGRIRRCISQEVNGNPNRKLATKNIKSMCQDELVQSAINGVYRELQAKKKIVSYLMRHEMILMLYGVFKVKK